MTTIQKVDEVWARLNEISASIKSHKESIETLENEEDAIHSKCEDDTTTLVLASLSSESNSDLRDIIISLKQDEDMPFCQLHNLCSDEQYRRWHELQRKVAETTGMYYDSGMSQSFFVARIWRELNAIIVPGRN